MCSSWLTADGLGQITGTQNRLHDTGRSLLPLRSLDEKHVVGELLGPVDRDDPRAVVRVAIIGNLEELLSREEPLVGHEALVHRAQLIDAKGRVAQGLPATTALFLREAEVGEYLLQCFVGDPGTVEQRAGSLGEQRRPQTREGQSSSIDLQGRFRLIPVVDEAEQDR